MMKATEFVDALSEAINEHGDFDVFTPDPLQPGWFNPVVDVQVSLGDENRIVVVSD